MARWAFFFFLFSVFGQRGKRTGIFFSVRAFFALLLLRDGKEDDHRPLRVPPLDILTCSVVGSEEEADEEAATARRERRRATETKTESERRARARAGAAAAKSFEGESRTRFVFEAAARGMAAIFRFAARSGGRAIEGKGSVGERGAWGLGFLGRESE